MDGKKRIRCRKGDEDIYETITRENVTTLVNHKCLNKKGNRYKPNIMHRESVHAYRNRIKRSRKSRSKSKKPRKSRSKSKKPRKSRSKRRGKY